MKSWCPSEEDSRKDVTTPDQSNRYQVTFSEYFLAARVPKNKETYTRRGVNRNKNTEEKKCVDGIVKSDL